MGACFQKPVRLNEGNIAWQCSLSSTVSWTFSSRVRFKPTPGIPVRLSESTVFVSLTAEHVQISIMILFDGYSMHHAVSDTLSARSGVYCMDLENSIRTQVETEFSCCTFHSSVLLVIWLIWNLVTPVGHPWPRGGEPEAWLLGSWTGCDLTESEQMLTTGCLTGSYRWPLWKLIGRFCSCQTHVVLFMIYSTPYNTCQGSRCDFNLNGYITSPNIPLATDLTTSSDLKNKPYALEILCNSCVWMKAPPYLGWSWWDGTGSFTGLLENLRL